MKNQGKVFEENFRASLNLDNPDLFYYRFKDSPASFGNQDNDFVRFTNNNICDNMIFYKGYLFLNELKSHHGKSLPLSCIKKNQLEGLLEVKDKNNIYPMLIIFFSDEERCFALEICCINQITDFLDRKSIPLSFCEDNGLEIHCRKLRTNYRYNVEEFLDEFINSIEKYK